MTLVKDSQRHQPYPGLLKYSVLAIVLTLPAGLWLNHTGNPMTYLTYHSPPGQICYLLSKLFGLLSASLLTGQIVLMLLSRRLSDFKLSVKNHRNMGIFTLLSILAHGGFFIAAKSIRGGEFAYQTLLPSFTKNYYTSAVSLGVIAFLLIIIVVISGLLRSNKKVTKLTRLIHKLSLIAAVLTAIHLSLISSDLYF